MKAEALTALLGGGDLAPPAPRSTDALMTVMAKWRIAKAQDASSRAAGRRSRSPQS